MSDSHSNSNTDIDGDTITYSCTVSGGGLSAGTNCTSLPNSSFSMNTSTGAVNWTPSLAAAVGGNATTYAISLVGSDTHGGSNSASFNVTVNPGVALNIPAVTTTTTSTQLSWTKITGANSYQVYRLSPFTPIGSVTAAACGAGPCTYTDSSLTPSTAYTYRVVALDSNGATFSTSLDVSVTTKSNGAFSSISTLTASEHVNAQTEVLSCTDVYANTNLFTITAQSDPSVNCSLTTNTGAIARVSCTPSYHATNGVHASWTSNVTVQCTINGANYLQTFAVNVANTNRNPSLQLSSGATQTASAQLPITVVTASDTNTNGATDIDGDTLSYSCTFSGGGFGAGTNCTSLPNSSFSINSSTGVFNWTPSLAAAVGGDATTYAISILGDDGHSGTNSTSFNVTVNPGVAMTIADATTTTTTTQLSWTKITGASSYQIYRLSPFTPLGAVSSGSCGATCTYTDTNLTASTSYTYRVIALDGAGSTFSTSLDVPITTKDIGTFTAISSLTASENSNAQTASLACSNTYSSTNLFSITSQSDSTANCVLTATTGASAKVSCTPSYHAAGGVHASWVNNVTVQCAMNGTNYTRTFAVNVANTNRAPSLAIIANQTVTAQSAITPVDANDTTASNDYDIDGDTLLYSCTFSGGGFGAGTACSSLPNNAFGFNTSTGVFSWTPSSAAATALTTIYSISITASDQRPTPLTNTKTFNVTVNPVNKLVLSGAASAATTACTPITVTYKDSSNSPITASYDMTVAIGSKGAGAIYSNNTCTTVIANPVILTGSSFKTFYFQDTTPENLTLTADSGSLIQGTLAFQTVPGAVNTLAFTNLPTTPTTTDNTMTLVVKAFDLYSNLLVNDSTSTITLTGYSSTDCSTGSVASALSSSSGILASGVATFTNIGIVKSSVQSIQASTGGKTVCAGSLTVNTGTAASMVATAGTGQTAGHNTTLSTPFSVTVYDSKGNGISNATVDWTITAGGGSLSSASNSTNASGVSSSTLTLGTAAGTNTAKATLHSNSAINVSINATSTLTALTYNWIFNTANSSSYTLSSSNINFTSNACQLTPNDQVDDDNTATGFAGGTFNGLAYGTLSDGTSTGLKLANNGGCDGTSTNCAELDSSWTPQWASLVSYYKMNGDWTDSKGTNNGTASNASFAAPKLGSYSGSFNGSSSYIDLGTASTLKPTAAITISHWVYFNSVTSGIRYLSDWHQLESTDRWVFLFTSDGVLQLVICNTGEATAALSSSVSLTTGIWYHIVGTYDGANVKIYVNGSLVGTPTALTGAMNTGTGASIRIGKQAEAGSAFNGNMDDVAIWNTALSASEIATIYNQQSAARRGFFTSRVMDAFSTGQSWTSLSWVSTLPFFKALPDYASGVIQNETSTNYSSLNTNTLMNGIVGLWHLDETTGTTGANSIKDSSGQGNHGTPTNVIFGTDGRLGTAATFNGTSGYINLGAPSTLIMGTSDWTTSAWFKTTAATTQYILAKSLYGAQTGRWGLGIGVNGTAGKVGFMFDFGSGGVAVESTLTYNDGKWHHAVATIKRNGNASIYVDGISVATSDISSHAAVNMSTSDNVLIGVYNDNVGAGPQTGLYFNGSLDEIAVWSRALGATEVQQLYQRGASRIKFQVKSCTTNTCSDNANWKGPDGTSATYFSELDNMSNQGTTGSPVSIPTGTVNTSLPTLTLNTYTSPVASARYFQYLAIFESDSATATLMPELKSVTVGPTHYDNTSPSVIGNNGSSYYSLSNFIQTLGSGGCAGTVGYNLSPDKVTWYYWNGSTWAAANGTAGQSNLYSMVASHIAAYGTQLGTGTVYIKAYLISSGTTACELSNLELDGMQ